MASLEHFGPAELNVIRAELSNAESLVSHYYCIPGREWPMYPYEIRTLSELGETEIDLNALAMVAKYGYTLKKTRGRLRYHEVYGICLQDHNILAVTRRACNPVALDALMLYILTHELVHVFRFASSLQPYLIEEEFRDQEESRVHRITNDILRDRRENSLQQVLDIFEDYPFGILER